MKIVDFLASEQAVFLFSQEMHEFVDLCDAAIALSVNLGLV